MSEKHRMTVGDLVLLLKEVPQDSLICIPSPEGSLVSNKNLYLKRQFINWWGDIVFIKCKSWTPFPDNE
jgi:hypothetical protein